MQTKTYQREFDAYIKRYEQAQAKLDAMPKRAKGRLHQQRLAHHNLQRAASVRSVLVRYNFVQEVNEAILSNPKRKYPWRISLPCAPAMEQNRIEPYTWAIEHIEGPWRMFYRIEDMQPVFIVAFASRTDASAFRIMWG